MIFFLSDSCYSHPMTAQRTSLLLLAAAILMVGSCVQTPVPPQTGQKHSTVPETLNDPRPEMPGMGPLGMPMR